MLKIKVCPIYCYYNGKGDNWYKSEQGINRVLGELARCGNQFVGDIKEYTALTKQISDCVYVNRMLVGFS